jgi:hypothetical protein
MDQLMQLMRAYLLPGLLCHAHTAATAAAAGA